MKDGDTSRSELRFIARTNEPMAAAKVENYLRLVGQSDGALKVTYDEQGTIDFEEQAKDAAPSCSDCDDGIKLMKGDAATHVNGQPCGNWAAPEADEAPLASARELGGTPQTKKKARE